MNFIFDNDRPIYVQLVEQLKLYIISGILEPGSRIPSVRELAIKTQVNPNTMQKALAELENEKLIYTQRTNGKFVTEDIELINKCKKQSAERKVQDFISDMKSLGIAKEEILIYLQNELRKSELEK